MREPGQRSEADVFKNREIGNKAIALPVFGSEGDASTDGVGHALQQHLFAAHGDDTGIGLTQACEGLQQLGAPASEQTVDSDYFALADGEADVMYGRPTGLARAEASNLQDGLCGGWYVSCNGRINGTAAHALDDPGTVHAATHAFADHPAIAQNGEVVAEIHEFMQAVRDVNENSGFMGERTGEFHQLTAAEGEIFGGELHGPRLHWHADALEGYATALLFGVAVDEHAGAHQLAASKDIFGDVQVAEHREFLMDNGDAGRRSVAG